MAAEQWTGSRDTAALSTEQKPGALLQRVLHCPTNAFFFLALQEVVLFFTYSNIHANCKR